MFLGLKAMLFAMLLPLLPVSGFGAEAAQPLPSADTLMQRVLNRSEARAKATNAPVWTYNKRAVMEKLDGDGKVKERNEKFYRVRMVQGVPIATLVKVEGRVLNQAEQEKESQSEAAFQKKVSGRDPKKTVAKREALIFTNLSERFRFTTLRREDFQGRQTVVVSFEAKPGKGNGGIPDQILDRITGTLWVDEATADVARLEARLTKELSLGPFGVLGTMKACQFELVSKPMPDGIWLPEKSLMSISARFFLSSMRFRMEETSDGFALEPEPKAGRQ